MIFLGQLGALRGIFQGIIWAIELIAHQGLGRSGPSASLIEILLDEPSVGPKFKIPGSVAHRRFNNLVADHDQEIAWAGGAIAVLGGKIRRFHWDIEIDNIRPRNR